MDRHYADIGGKPINLNKEESEMSDQESARRVFRAAIRETISRSVAVIISRPFAGDLTSEDIFHVIIGKSASLCSEARTLPLLFPPHVTLLEWRRHSS